MSWYPERDTGKPEQILIFALLQRRSIASWQDQTNLLNGAVNPVRTGAEGRIHSELMTSKQEIDKADTVAGTTGLNGRSQTKPTSWMTNFGQELVHSDRHSLTKVR